MTILDDPPDVEAADPPEAASDRPAAPAAAAGDATGTGSDGAGDAASDEYVEPPLPPLRVGFVVACPTLAAAAVIGAIFDGPQAKILPALAGLCGIAVAAQASRRKRALVVNLTIAVGVLGIGLALLATAGFENVTRLVPELREAAAARKVLRPPAEFLPGFRVIVGWLMAMLGFTAGWIGIELRKPALGLLAPLPMVIVGAISVPDSAKLPVGVVVLVLFLAGLTLLSSLQGAAAGSDGDLPSLGYELRRMVKVVPLLGVLCLVMVLLARSNFLFPDPIIDPVRSSQRPKAIPLSAVEDKVLFQVRSRSTGPWRVGLLDVYDGTEWRIPAFAESELRRVPRNGIVDDDFGPATRADFLVKGLGGAVLPGLPNTVGIVAEGPRLGYDERTGSIRLVEGQIAAGLTYTVSGAALPTEEQLVGLTPTLPRDLRRFLDMPDPPPGVAALLAEAPAEPAWSRLDFVRKRLLETVTASGPGLPVAVPPSKVEDMLVGSKEGSPFEIVAAQAMLARWAGVPARIGYGYDGGDVVGDGLREVRPRHGSSWLEVWFPTFKWFPVIGAPLKAKPSLSSDGPSNQDPTVVASDDIAVQVFIPLRVPERGFLYDQIRRIVLLLIPVLTVLGAVWVAYPALVKAQRRRRRRRWAETQGPVTQLQVSYAEFRDLCHDFGLGRQHATPLAFLDVFVPDEEHAELAWLVTRCLYGDLRDAVGPDEAFAASELSSVLRRRLVRAQPPSLRFIAAVSRLSLRGPYAADVQPPSRRLWRRAERHAPVGDTVEAEEARRAA